ncbi:hypothetical protein AB447_208890 [Bacillus glycinifermentans]|uniref:Uncharacterized protein n=1 Tax=Bacillus glycinifermentans TaxID=1664069 RepID=A0A0T6BI22_9BACI|nr:hypothetical protein AB447_208890 [Bacillus glycinifermentans]
MSFKLRILISLIIFFFCRPLTFFIIQMYFLSAAIRTEYICPTKLRGWIWPQINGSLQIFRTRKPMQGVAHEPIWSVVGGEAVQNRNGLRTLSQLAHFMGGSVKLCTTPFNQSLTTVHSISPLMDFSPIS